MGLATVSNLKYLAQQLIDMDNWAFSREDACTFKKYDANFPFDKDKLFTSLKQGRIRLSFQ